MFGNMMGKLQEAQKQIEETKERLNTVYHKEEARDGKLSITISGNRKISDIHIDEALMEDPEELSDLLILTLNKAIEKASEINEREMQNAATGMMNIPGMDKLFR